MRILVTGATGGLGELVINNLLVRNIEVIATSRDIKKAKLTSFYDRVTYKPYDINENSNTDLFSYFKKPDAVIHLAWEKLNDYWSSEHTGVILDNHKSFLSNLIKNGTKNITGIGTCYEYGLKEGIAIESDSSNPTLPYSQGKNLLREYLEQEQNKWNFSFKWLRIFYVFGEIKGRKNLYRLITNAVKNGDVSFNMSPGEQIRDFLSPAEIAEIIVCVSLQEQVQGLVNCCSGNPIKLKDKVIQFLETNHYKLKLNLGFYPYTDYEPMETWGSVVKLKKALTQNKFEN